MAKLRNGSTVGGSKILTLSDIYVDKDGNVTVPNITVEGGKVTAPNIEVLNDGTLKLGPNSSNGKYLLIGGPSNQGSADIGTITVTDGNLHIDAADGKELLLNYYNGSGISFGNGNAGKAAFMDSAGQLYKGGDNTGDKYWHAGNLGNTDSNGAINPDNTTMNGLYYADNLSLFSQSDGGLFSQAYSDIWQGQIYIDYRTGKLASRGKNNGTWTAWNTVWTSNNDGSGSGLDADVLRGVAPAEAATASTIVKRNASKDIFARLLRSEYTTDNASPNYIMTQVTPGVGTDNYVRPTSKSTFRSAVTDDYYVDKTTESADLLNDHMKIEHNSSRKSIVFKYVD